MLFEYYCVCNSCVGSLANKPAISKSQRSLEEDFLGKQGMHKCTYKHIYTQWNTFITNTDLTKFRIYLYIYNTGSYATIITLILYVDICIIRVHT